MKSITIIIFITIITFIKIPPAFAQEDSVGFSKIHPASPFYFLKTVRENLELKFALTSRTKMLRQLEFATRRLREARTLIPINQDLIPPILERYISHLNTLPDKDLEDKEIVARIKESTPVHLEVLQKMYQQISSTRAEMAIRSTMNKIIKRADLPTFAKLPVCTFFAREASSSALNQTEQFVLADRADKCRSMLLP